MPNRGEIRGFFENDSETPNFFLVGPISLGNTAKTVAEIFREQANGRRARSRHARFRWRALWPSPPAREVTVRPGAWTRLPPTRMQRSSHLDAAPRRPSARNLLRVAPAGARTLRGLLVPRAPASRIFSVTESAFLEP